MVLPPAPPVLEEKGLHEQFVTGLQGGPLWEVCVLITCVPVLVYMLLEAHLLLLPRAAADGPRVRQRPSPRQQALHRTGLELWSLTLPVLTLVTLLSDRVPWLLLSWTAYGVVMRGLRLAVRLRQGSLQQHQQQQQQQQQHGPLSPTSTSTATTPAAAESELTPAPHDHQLHQAPPPLSSKLRDVSVSPTALGAAASAMTPSPRLAKPIGLVRPAEEEATLGAASTTKRGTGSGTSSFEADDGTEKHGEWPKRQEDSEGFRGGKLACLTIYRGGTMLLTCICILAVDFHVFPRRFAKTEMFGTSLMDVGVGSFIVSSAITSKFARSGLHGPVSVRYFYDTSIGGWKRLLQLAAVLVLGLGRLVFVKLTNYQEHVSEYGVHWNFFVTLALVWAAADCVRSVIPRRHILPLAIAVGCLYQCVLTLTPLTEYVETAPRNTTLFAANREGVLSWIGFTVLYLITEDLSHSILWAKEDTGRTQLHPAQMAKLLYVGAACGVVYGVSTAALQPCSRRLANLPFVALSLGINFVQIAALAAMERLTFGPWASVPCASRLLQPQQHREATAMDGGCNPALLLPIVTGASEQQLLVFLCANLLTGLVNITMPTIYMASFSSFCVLAVYTLLVSFVCLLANADTRSALLSLRPRPPPSPVLPSHTRTLAHLSGGRDDESGMTSAATPPAFAADRGIA